MAHARPCGPCATWPCRAGPGGATVPASRSPPASGSATRSRADRYTDMCHGVEDERIRESTPQRATACHGTPRHAAARRGTSRHAAARRGTSRHRPRHAAARRGTLRHAAACHGTPRHARHVHQFYICHLLDWSSKSEHSTARGARRSTWGTPRHVGHAAAHASHGDPRHPTAIRSGPQWLAAHCGRSRQPAVNYDLL